MFQGTRVFVVVPAHNEQRLIARTLRGIPSFVDRIVVVDDASSDDTGGAAQRVGDPRVRVLRHATNQGVGAAIVSGYRHAFEHDAEVVVVMAGDDQMHPEDLPALLRPVVEGGADYAKGDRLHHPDAKLRMPFARRIGGWVMSQCTRAALDLESLSDSQCGYTVISRAAISALDLADLWPRFGYPNDLLGQLRARSLRCCDVVVRPVYADERSELKARHVAVILMLIARAAWRVRGRRFRRRHGPGDMIEPEQGGMK